MVNYKIDSVKFSLNEKYDFSWLQAMGKVFAVFDQNDSGNISFGVDSGKEKYFVKVAGLNTTESVQSKENAIATLKKAMLVYEEIRYEKVIKLIRHYSLDSLYVAVFEWVEGECLFDHWNFEKYELNPQIIPPAKRFKQLTVSKRIELANIVFSFLEIVSEKGYVAVDFYDGSIMYDFHNDAIKICDIDLFRKKPTFNDVGMNYWGTKRVKAPEEYQYGAVIDEKTNVYTLGAILFNSFFGNYTDAEMKQIYEKNSFLPCPIESWELGRECYEVVLKAVSKDKSERYTSIRDFHMAWNMALANK